MLRQIEKLQKMVNNLLGLCREAGAGAKIDEIPYDTSHRKHEKLGVLILKLQDGVSSKRSNKKLQNWIACDEEARLYYIDFIKLTILLQMHFQPGKFTQSFPTECCL